MGKADRGNEKVHGAYRGSWSFKAVTNLRICATSFFVKRNNFKSGDKTFDPLSISWLELAFFRTIIQFCHRDWGQPYLRRWKLFESLNNSFRGPVQKIDTCVGIQQSNHDKSSLLSAWSKPFLIVAIISSGVSSPSQLPANSKKSSGHSSCSFVSIKSATHLDRDFPETFMALFSFFDNLSSI